MLSEPVVPRGPLDCFPQQTHREPVLLWTLMELVLHSQSSLAV